MDTTGEKEEDVQEKRGWKEYKQPWHPETSNQSNGETERMAFGSRKTAAAVKQTG